MSKELVLTTKDLTEVGIDSRLTSNDLVEVVAHDIYDAYMRAVGDAIKVGNGLSAKYYALMDSEIGKMKAKLKEFLNPNQKVNVRDEDDFDDDDEDDNPTSKDNIIASFSSVSGIYWGRISAKQMSIRERDKGTIIETSTSKYSVPNLKIKTAKILLTISTGTQNEKKDINKGDISGTIETSVSKKFALTVEIPTERFRNFNKEVEAYNEDVDALMNALPKNGALSVERFTREARVKMNKKIISAQSPDFRKKISELFNIKL